jgi:hypothetical protein
MLLKRPLEKRAPDPERDQLKNLIRDADIPAPIKALAVIGVGNMTDEQVSQALAAAPALMAAVKGDDREAAAQVLRDNGLDEQTILDAMDYYDRMIGNAQHD